MMHISAANARTATLAMDWMLGEAPLWRAVLSELNTAKTSASE